MLHFHCILQNLTEALGGEKFLFEFSVIFLVIFVLSLFQIRSGGKVSNQCAPGEKGEWSLQPTHLAHEEWEDPMYRDYLPP